MNHRDELSPATQRPTALLLPIGLVLSLLIFVGTYFTYFYLHQSHAPGSYLPLVVGISAFFGLMVWFNFLAFSKLSIPVRLVKAIGIALAESAVFFLVFLFLVLNTIGA